MHVFIHGLVKMYNLKCCPRTLHVLLTISWSSDNTGQHGRVDSSNAILRLKKKLVARVRKRVCGRTRRTGKRKRETASNRQAREDRGGLSDNALCCLELLWLWTGSAEPQGIPAKEEVEWSGVTHAIHTLYNWQSTMPAKLHR